MNFKIALIAVFFFFLLFELHSPVFKPAATGYVPTSMGHYKFDETRECQCPEGTEFIKTYEEYCTCWDSLTQKIIPVDKI